MLRHLEAGFAVIGDTQFLPGYCVLLVDEPGVQRLSDLPGGKRMAFLSDMERLGEAVERACRKLDPAFRRVNLEILGNTDGFLHAHVWPRYEWEPEDLISRPVWLYPQERWTSEEFALGPGTPGSGRPSGSYSISYLAPWLTLRPSDEAALSTISRSRTTMAKPPVITIWGSEGNYAADAAYCAPPRPLGVHQGVRPDRAGRPDRGTVPAAAARLGQGDASAARGDRRDRGAVEHRHEAT